MLLSIGEIALAPNAFKHGQAGLNAIVAEELIHLSHSPATFAPGVAAILEEAAARLDPFWPFLPSREVIEYPMTARFLASKVFVLAERRVLAVVGRVLTGELRVGMSTRISPTSESPRHLTIRSIGLIQPGSEEDQIALLFPYPSEDELRTWQEAVRYGDILEFTG